MALGIGDNFKYQGKKPNFERDSFKTKAEMKDFPESSMNEGHVSYCEEDGNHYEFKSSNSVDVVTGKWREFKTKVDLSGYATKDELNSNITEYNVSKHHPTSGIGGTNKFTLAEAIKLIPQELRSVGIKCSFVDETGIVNTYEYVSGNSMSADNWKNVNLLSEKLLPMGDRLPMVLKSSKLTDEISSGRTLTPYLASLFLLDFKIDGVPEEGAKYRFRFQYQQKAEDTITYANYLFLTKEGADGSYTDIGTLTIGAVAPSGCKIYNLSIDTLLAPTIKGAYVLLNYDVINNFIQEGLATQYSTFGLQSFTFNQSYIFDLTTGPIAEDKKKHEELVGINTKINNATRIAESNKAILAEKVVWQLANDMDFFKSYYSLSNIGQYSDPQKELIFFNSVVINGICSENTDDVLEYRIYIVNENVNRDQRGCPVGAISDKTHTMIKKGTLQTRPWLMKNYEVVLDKQYTLMIGEQVAVYLSSQSFRDIRMTGGSNIAGNPEQTSHVCLIHTGHIPFDGGIWYAGSLSGNVGYFNVALTLKEIPYFVKKDGFQQQVESIVDTKIAPLKPLLEMSITIPDKIYAVVGTEMNIWNDTVSLSIDKGLMSPINYVVKWHCTKGLITDRCFRFKPTANDVGQYECTCTIFDMGMKQLDTKTFKIVVLAKDAVKSQKNIVYVGDSLGQSAASELYNNFNNVGKFSGVIPRMLGTRGTAFKFEAVGGYGWSDYATSGRYVYRIFVSNVTSANVGATYTLPGYVNPFTVREVNINDGNGNMLIEYQYGNKAANFPATGTITLKNGGGDSTISFTGGKEEPNNPLWNKDTGKLDVSLYKTRLGLLASDKIDAVSFQFGINDNWLANNLPQLKKYITDLYNAFIQDNPNCKIIVGLTTSAGNDFNGAGANYGATYDCISYLQNVYNIRKYYLSLANDTAFPNLVIAPTHLFVDRYYGYNLVSREISQRHTDKEQYHNNYVHPGSSGYGQMADAFMGAFMGALV